MYAKHSMLFRKKKVYKRGGHSVFLIYKIKQFNDDGELINSMDYYLHD